MKAEGILYYCSQEDNLAQLYLKGIDCNYKVLLEFNPYMILAEEKLDEALEKVRTIRFKRKGKNVAARDINVFEAYDMGVKRRVARVSLEREEDRREFERRTGFDYREVDVDPIMQYLSEWNLLPFQWIRVEGEKKSEYNSLQIIKANNLEALDKFDSNLKWLAFTIAIHSDTGYPRAEKDPIVGISLRWRNGEKLLLAEELDDKGLISDFLNFICEFDPDMIVGYGQDIDDFPYVFQRARMHGLSLSIGRDGSEPIETGKYFRGMILKEVKIPGRINLDLFPIAWRDFPALPTKSITEMAEALGIDVPTLLKPHKIGWAWRENKPKLEEHLKNKIELILQIFEKVYGLQVEFSRLTGLPLHEVIRTTVGDLVEAMIYREAKKRGWILPRREKGRREFFAGGFVWLKSPGIHENVGYLDFKSMYPSIIRSFNISPETVNPDSRYPCMELTTIELAEGKRRLKFKVCKKPKGLISDLIGELLDMREKIKAEMKKHEPESPTYRELYAKQHVLRVLANAIYGYMGWSGASFYKLEAAQLIAALGRKFIREVGSYIESRGFKAIYVDTDGIQIVGGSEEDYLKLIPEINEKFPITIEYRQTAKKALYLTKKKYVHLIDGKLDAKGFEFIRKDYPPIIKEAQRKVVEALLAGKGVDEALKTAREYKRRILEGRVTVDDLAIVEQIGKKLEEFERKTKGYYAGKWLKENMGIEVHRGINLNIIVIKGGGSINERARPAEFFSVEDCDLKYYAEMLDQVIERTIQAVSG